MANMEDASPYKAPLLVPNPEQDEVFPRPELYRAIIGKLVWISRSTLADICSCVSKLARGLADPMMTDFNDLKKLLRYLKGTLDWGITLGVESVISAYCDANSIT
jgi:hypothetical protein